MSACVSDNNEQNIDVMSGQELYGNRGIVCPDVLCAEIIRSNLTTNWYGCRIFIMDETDSTNEELKRKWDRLPTGALVLAKRQTGGKGRMGRSWESRSETGIWMSFMIKPDIRPCNISSLTLVVAMACQEAIKRVVHIDTHIKWPNDIVVNGKKLVGILTETSFENNKVNYVIIGIGINVSMKKFPAELASRATSFTMEGLENIDRNLLVAEIGSCFEKYYDIYVMNENMSGLKSEYENKLVNIDKEVVVIEADSQFKGIAKGINDSGELMIQVDGDRIVCVRSGEVSVRGVYGYV